MRRDLTWVLIRASALMTLKEGLTTWIFVVKLTVPALVLTRFLLYFDLIGPLASWFEPIMGLMGLPPEVALVWVAGMLSNIYVAISVYLALFPLLVPGLTLAQMTTLAGLCLLAHALLVEGQICRGAGLSFWRVTIFRFLAALIWGVLVCQAAGLTGWGAEPAQIKDFISLASEPIPPWLVWFWLTLKQLFLILVLIVALMFMMKLIRYFDLNRLFMKILASPLRLAGVGESAVMVTVIGCLVGLTYGGGLIMAEGRSGRLARQDIYGAMLLMSVFHSPIEDTLLFWTLGASIGWLLAGRLLLSLALIAGLTRLARRSFWRPILVGSAGRPGP